MPKYQLNGRTYNIPENIAGKFESDNPNATMSFEADGNRYNIPVSKRDGFLKKFPEAKLVEPQKQKQATAPSAPINPVAKMMQGVKDTLAPAPAPAAAPKPSETPAQQPIQQYPNTPAGKYDSKTPDATVMYGSSPETVNSTIDQMPKAKAQPAPRDTASVAQTAQQTPTKNNLPRWMREAFSSLTGEPVQMSDEEQKSLNNEIRTRLMARSTPEQRRQMLEREYADKLNKQFEEDLTSKYDQQTIAANKKQVEKMRQEYVNKNIDYLEEQYQPMLEDVQQMEKLEQEKRDAEKKEFLRKNPQYDKTRYSDIEESGALAQAKKGARFEQLRKEGLNNEIADANAEIANLQHMLEAGKSWQNEDVTFDYNAPVSPIASDDTPVVEEYKDRFVENGHKDVDEDDIYAAIRQKRDQIRILEAERDDAGFIQGIVDAAVNPSFWSFGVKDVETALALNKAKTAIDNGRELTPSQKALLDATVGKQEAEEAYAGNRGFGYNAANVTVNAVPFVGEFIATGGGFNAISATGKAAGRLLGMQVKNNLAKYALRHTGTALGDIASAFTMTATTGSARTLADIEQRHLGNVQKTEDGYTFVGGEDWGDAATHGLVANTLEYYTEKLGDHLGILGKGAGAVGRKLGIDKGIEKIGLSKISPVLARIQGTDFFKQSNNLLRKGGIHELPSEVMEEEANILLNSVLVGDNKISDLWDLKTQVDLIGGLGVSIGFMRAPAWIKSGRQAAGYYAYKTATEDASRKAEGVFSPDTWQIIKNEIDNSENKNLTDILLQAAQGKGFNREQKEAIFYYADSLLKMRGYDLATLASAREQTETGQPVGTPRTASLSYQGNTINELDEQGNVIASHTFENNDERQAIIQGIYDRRANADMIADYEVLRQIDGEQAQTVLNDFATQYNMNVQSLLDIMQKDPMARTDNEAALMESLATTIHEAAYPEGVAHPAQSFQDGQKDADNTPLTPTQSPEGPVASEATVQLDALQQQAQAAQQALETFLKSHDDIREATNGLSPVEAIDYITNNFSGSERDEAINIYSAAINATAKLQGYQQQLQGNVDNYVQSEVEARTFKGTINGQPAEEGSIFTIHDGEESYTLVSGNLSATPEGIIDPESSSEMLIVLDSDGTFIPMHPNGRMTLEQGSMQAFADNLRAEYTPVSAMPSQSDGQTAPEEPQQSENAGGEAGPLAGANEPSAPASVEEPTTVPEASAEGSTPVPTIESVTGEDGVKRYEQGIPVDQAIDDMLADNLDVNEEADLAINEAQEELNKIKAPKTRAERVKSAARRQELQGVIDYYNNVKRRNQELHPVYADAQPFLAQLNTAQSKKKADEILNAAIQAGVNPADIQQAHTEKVNAILAKRGDALKNRQKAIQQEWDKAKQKYEANEIPFNADWSVPDTVEELASMYIGGQNNLAWENTSDGKRGFKEAMGAASRKIEKDSESSKFNYLFSKTGEGIGFDELVHTIYESPENNGRWSTEQITDAILTLFREANEGRDITDYMLRNRTAQSERLLQAKQAAQEEAAEAPSAFQEENAPSQEGQLPFPPMNENEEVPFGGNEQQKEQPAAEDEEVQEQPAELPANQENQEKNTENQNNNPLEVAKQAKAEKEYGKSNTLVTQDRYNELRERMRKKLLGQLNLGFDPEILAIGVEMAMYHVEAGAKKFADFAQRMIADLGDAIRPYLQGIYENAKRAPGMEQLRKEMDSTETVDNFDVQNFDKTVDDSVNDNKENSQSKKNKVTSQPKQKNNERDIHESLSEGGNGVSTEDDAASDILQGCSVEPAEDGQGSRPKQRLLAELEKKSRNSGYWISDIHSVASHAIGVGGENEVYLSNDGNFVIKLNDFEYLDDNATNFDDVINRIKSQGELFPDVPLKILGFAKNSKGKICVVLQQPYIENAREATEKEIDDLLEKLGFYEDITGALTEDSGRFAISDVKPNNVLVGEDGKLHFVDVITYDEQLPGKMMKPKKQNNANEEDQTVNEHKDILPSENNDVSSQQEAEQKSAENLEGDSAEFAERQENIGKLREDIGRKLRQAVLTGDNQIKTMQAVKSLAKEYGLEDMSMTDLQEMVEAEVVDLARTVAQSQDWSDEKKFDYIKKLYENQPTLSARDNDRINMQQYSTPAPMAFLMGMFAKPKDGRSPRTLEPSAGNGMLTINLPKETTHVNDIDEMRLSNLQKQGFGQVTSQDGLQPFEPKAYDVVVTNPPFGNVTPKVYDGIYEISGLEHQMAINALESMKDDGRAAIIIGGNTEYNTNGSIKGKNRAFLNYLYSHYNVVDVINMDGKTLYAKQGTGYPVRMILINGRKQFDTNTYAPVQSKARAEQVKTYEELYNRVNDDILHREQQGAASVLNTAGEESGRVDDSNNAGTSTQTGVSNVRAGGSTGEHPVLDESGRSVSGRGDTTGQGADTEGHPVVGAGLSDVGGRTEPDGNGGSTDAQTDSGRGQRGRRELPVGRDNAERPDGGNDIPVGVGQRGAGTPQSDEQPEQQRGLSTEKVPYKKQSGNPFTLQSLMPAEQADEVKKILEGLGDVDQFLVDELGYSSKEELHQALAAEQIDSVAMAINQMNQGNAFIIGDMTGIGKGRQAAALIRYGVKKGGFPVFVTVKKGLFSDMYRDLCDIGSPDLRPFIWCADDKEHSQNITDSDGNVVFKWSQKEQQRVADYINKNGKLPPEYDYVVTTYDGFKSGTIDYEGGQKKARTFKEAPKTTALNGQKRRDALETLCRGSYIIMDESHNAGGDKSNISKFLQYITAMAKGTTFLSATFAKRPENMPIYALRTAISKAGVKVDELIAAVKRGGATFQEVMSKALTGAGQMIRRERDMTGVTIDWKGIEDEAVVQKQREQYDQIIGLFNEIIDFQRTYVDPIVNQMNDDEADVQGSVDHTPGTRDMGINNTPFASRTYNIVQQVLLSLKAEETAKRAIDYLKQGKKPVIAVANTNEKASEEAASNELEEDMEMPDLSVNLLKGLEKTMSITKTDANNKKTTTMIPFDRLSPEGQQRYHEIEEHIQSASTGLSLSPIDVIKNELKKAGYKVGELTGRKAEFVYNEDGTVKRLNRVDKDKKKVAAGFNNGTIDALILNRSAGTGISLHSSTKFKDQRQRVMVVAQAQGDVNDEVQIRGRIDRTGQVQRGAYEYVVSQIPSEQRLLMMLKAKLRSLDANTTSSQKSKFNEMQVQDIINKYGDQIVVQYLAEHPDTYSKLADPLKWGESVYDAPVEALISSAAKGEEEGATASKILGRMALLKVEEQEKMLADISVLYQAEIDRLNEMGENDLEITEMPLKAKTLSKQVWEQGIEPGGKNPFADNTYVEKVNMDVLKKPMKGSEVKAAQQRLLNSAVPEGTEASWENFKQATMEKVNKWAEEKKAETTKTITERAEKKAAAEQERYVKGAKKAQEKNGMTDEEIERNGQHQYDNIYKEEIKKLDDALAAVEAQKQVFEDALDTFNTDGVYAIPSNIYDISGMDFEPGLGKLIDVKITDNFSPNASTLSFATLDGRRKITIPINGKVKQQNNEKANIFPKINSLTAQAKSGWFGQNLANTVKVLEQNTDNWDKLTSSAARKDGYIITGNLLKALTSTRKQGVGGKLISYTTDTGEVRQGILMPENFDPGALTSDTPISAKKDELKYYGDKVTSADGDVTIKVTSYNWRPESKLELSVPKSTKRGGKYFNDETLRSLMDEQFEGSAKLRAEFDRSNLDAVLHRLDELGVTVKEEAKTDSNDTGRRYSEDLDSDVQLAYNELQQKYNSLPISVIRSDVDDKKLIDTIFGEGEYEQIPEDEKEEAVKNVREYFKIIAGGYSRETKKITIFADHNRDNKKALDEVGERFFHENLHGILHKWYGEAQRGIADRFWDAAPEKVGRHTKKIVEKYYDEKERKEEFFVRCMAEAMDNGTIDIISDILKDNDADQQRINELLNELGYDRARETEERKEVRLAREAGRNQEEGDLGSRGSRGVAAPTVAQHVEKLLDKLGTKDRTTVYQSFDELPEEDKRHIEQMHREGRKVRGWYENGQIFLYLPDIESTYQAEKTIWHETVAHHGLRNLLGEEAYNKLLDNLWLHHKDPAMSAWVSERMQQNGWSLHQAIDEWLAREAEKTVADNTERKSLWKKLTQWLADALRKIGYRFAPNINDTRYLFWLSENHLDPANPLSEAKRNALLRKLDNDIVVDDIKGENGERRYSEDVETPSATQAQRNYERALNRMSYVWKEAHIDSLQSACELVKAMSGIKKMEDVPSHENFILSINQQSSKEDAIDYKFMRDYMQPIDEAVAKILPDLDKKNRKRALRQLQTYMMKKHGLERNRVLFVRDWLRQERAKVDIADQQAIDAIDQAEDYFEGERDRLFEDLQNGAIDLRDYFAQLDDVIRKVFDNTYDPAEHDYSGLSALNGIEKQAGSTASYDDAQAIDDVISFEDHIGSKRLDELWEVTNRATQFSIDTEYNAGLISKETYDHVNSMFNWYVPLRGYDETMAEDVYDYPDGENPRNFVGPTLRNARGRKSLADTEVFATIGAMASRSIRTSLSNQSKQAFARFARHYKDSGLVTELGYAWMEKHIDANGQEEWIEVQPDIPEDATGDKVAQIVRDFEDDMKQKAANGNAKRIHKNDGIPYKFINRENKNQHIIDVWINGSKHQFVINGNPRAAMAINGLMSATRGSNILWMSSLSHFMAKMNTSYSPDFIVRNTMRDAIFAFTNTGIKENPKYAVKWTKNYARLMGRMLYSTPLVGRLDTPLQTNLFNRYRNGKLNPNNKTDMYFKEFMENGGQTGWVELKNKEKWKKLLEKDIKSRLHSKAGNVAIKGGDLFWTLTFGFTESLNERAENMARFATYMTSREMGRSIKRAVSDAKEISVNFNRKGSGKKSSGFVGTHTRDDVSWWRRFNSVLAGWSAQNLQDYIMFYNAGIQSVNNLAKNAKAHPIKSTAAFAGFALAAFIMPELNKILINALGGDDDDKKLYAELPEYIRRNNLCIFNGHGYTLISLPIELRAMYGIGDMAASYLSHPELRNGKGMVMDILSQLSQISPLDFFGEQSGNPLWALVPSGIRPVFESFFNVNWLGIPIQRERSKWNQLDPSWMLSFNNVNDLYINLSKKLNAATNSLSKEDIKKMGLEEKAGEELDASVRGWADSFFNPSIAQHLVESYFGGVGKTVNNYAHVAKMFGAGEDAKTVLKSGKVPVFRAVFYGINEQNAFARTRNKWYYYQDEVEKTEDLQKKLRKSGVVNPMAAIQGMSEEYNKKAYMMQLFKEREKRYDQMKKTRDNTDDLEQKAIIQKDMDKLMQETVEMLDEIEEKMADM